MAAVRPRRHSPLLRLTAQRDRDDQVEPAEDHCSGQRLARLQRAEEAAGRRQARLLDGQRGARASPSSDRVRLRAVFTAALRRDMMSLAIGAYFFLIAFFLAHL